MAPLSTRRKQERIIDESLKRIYEEAVAEDMPDRFAVLLDALKEQDQPNNKGK